jgi:hypothetical protein
VALSFPSSALPSSSRCSSHLALSFGYIPPGDTFYPVLLLKSTKTSRKRRNGLLDYVVLNPLFSKRPLTVVRQNIIIFMMRST